MSKSYLSWFDWESFQNTDDPVGYLDTLKTGKEDDQDGGNQMSRSDVGDETVRVARLSSSVRLLSNRGGTNDQRRQHDEKEEDSANETVRQRFIQPFVNWWQPPARVPAPPRRQQQQQQQVLSARVGTPAITRARRRAPRAGDARAQAPATRQLISGFQLVDYVHPHQQSLHNQQQQQHHQQQQRQQRQREATSSQVTFSKHASQLVTTVLRNGENSGRYRAATGSDVAADDGCFNAAGRPRDFAAVAANIGRHAYRNRAELMADVEFIAQASNLLNGPGHAESLRTMRTRRAIEVSLFETPHGDALKKLEFSAQSDVGRHQFTFSCFLVDITVKHLKQTPGVWLFLSSATAADVATAAADHRHSGVAKRMDLSRLLLNVQHHMYQGREGYLRDLALIGAGHFATGGSCSSREAPAKMMDECKDIFGRYREKIERLEASVLTEKIETRWSSTL